MESPSTWHRLSALVRSLYNTNKGESYANDIVSYVLVDDIFINSRNLYVRKEIWLKKMLSPIGSNIGRAFFCLYYLTQRLPYGIMYTYQTNTGENNGRSN